MNQVISTRSTHSLNQFSLLNYFKPDQTISIQDSYDESHYKKEEVIYRKGNTPLGLYYIDQGKVKILRHREDGKEQILRIIKIGDFLGHENMLLGNRYNNTAVALEDVVLFFIPKTDFFKVLAENAIVSQKFMELLSKELLETEQKLVDLAYKPVRGRLAEALISLDNESDQKENSGQPHCVSLTRHNLANLIGTATETVVRTLTEFKQEKLLLTEGKKIRILNKNGLKDVSKMYN